MKENQITKVTKFKEKIKFTFNIVYTNNNLKHYFR
jgi:hypothetical protein